MKNTLSQLLFLLLTTFIISASSCHKEDPEPDLVPITTTGANTMGFYVDGIPVNIKGKDCWSCSQGVKGGVSAEHVLSVSGGGGNPYKYVSIELLLYQYPLQDYNLVGTQTGTNWVTFTKTGTLGGTIFFCDSMHTGKLTLLRLEQNMAAGTFYFDAVNPETGKVIHVTDGRFDIQFF